MFIFYQSPIVGAKNCLSLPRSLDEEADRVGITRQSIIKVWLAERLKVERSAESASNKSVM